MFWCLFSQWFSMLYVYMFAECYLFNVSTECENTFPLVSTNLNLNLSCPAQTLFIENGLDG